MRVWVIRRLGEERDSISLGPVESSGKRFAQSRRSGYVREDILVLVKDSVAQWHLVNVDSLLDTEFGLPISLILDPEGSKAHNKDIKCGVQHTGDPSFANDRSIPLSKVVNQHTEVQVDRLLLCQLGTFCDSQLMDLRYCDSWQLTLLHVALLSTLCDLISIHEELDVV